MPRRRYGNKNVYKTKQNYDYGQNYYGGNSSLAYDYEVLPEYPQPRPVRKKVRVYKRKAKTQYRYINSHERAYSKQTYILIFTVFLGCMFSLTMFSLNINKKMAIANLNSQIKTTQEDNIALQSTITENYDLKEIERIATTKLGMVKPKSYQIVPIDVPKESYVVQFEESKPEIDENSVVSNLLKFLNK